MKRTTENILLILLTAALSVTTVYGQSKSNLDNLFELLDKETAAISSKIENSGTKLLVDFDSPNDLKIFKNRFITQLNNYFAGITTDRNEAGIVLGFTLEQSSVEYNETFRDGLFGDYFVERKSNIGGSYNISEKGSITFTDNFNLSKVDTVKYNEINSLENYSLPFTRDEIPEEPFFSSLVEPVIAIGSAVVAVLLFFTVRSK